MNDNQEVYSPCVAYSLLDSKIRYSEDSQRLAHITKQCEPIAV